MTLDEYLNRIGIKDDFLKRLLYISRNFKNSNIVEDLAKLFDRIGIRYYIKDDTILPDRDTVLDFLRKYPKYATGELYISKDFNDVCKAARLEVTKVVIDSNGKQRTLRYEANNGQLRIDMVGVFDDGIESNATKDVRDDVRNG